MVIIFFCQNFERWFQTSIFRLWMSLFCETVRNFGVDGLKRLLKEISRTEWVTQTPAPPQASAGQCFITHSPPGVKWDLKSCTTYAFPGFELPDVSENTSPATQSTARQSLVCIRAIVINKHVWWRWREQKLRRKQNRKNAEGDYSVGYLQEILNRSSKYKMQALIYSYLWVFSSL